MSDDLKINAGYRPEGFKPLTIGEIIQQAAAASSADTGKKNVDIYQTKFVDSDSQRNETHSLAQYFVGEERCARFFSCSNKSIQGVGYWGNTTISVDRSRDTPATPKVELAGEAFLTSTIDGIKARISASNFGFVKFDPNVNEPGNESYNVADSAYLAQLGITAPGIKQLQSQSARTGEVNREAQKCIRNVMDTAYKALILENTEIPAVTCLPLPKLDPDRTKAGRNRQ
jgi:hypothetical protein